MLLLEDLRMSYRRSKQPVVNDICLDIAEGEFFTLLGPSGCGKTSTLRCIAGLETPTSGRIEIGGVTVYSGRPPVFVPPHRRDIAMVFQSYAIWPHLTVAQNVAFPLEAARTPREQVRKQVMEALEMVGLADLADRPAPLLSGGQQQRVAFARAIVKHAKLLLLDEPLSNLDAKLRTQMRAELRGLQQRLGITTVFVTHDQAEALSMSDRIAVLDAGSVVALGTPLDLYLTPPDIATARFVGQAELVPGRLVSREGSLAVVQTDLGVLRCGVCQTAASGAVFVLVRPEHIRVLPRQPRNDTVGKPSQPNSAEGTITAATFSGRYCEYSVDVSGRTVRAESSETVLWTVGETVTLEFPVERCVVLADTESENDSSEESVGSVTGGRAR